VSIDDRWRVEPELCRDVYESLVEDSIYEEVEDLGPLLQQHDRHATTASPEETHNAFQYRNNNNLSNRRHPSWKPRSWAPYEALSYVWGEPIFSQVAHTPDGFIPITPSLADALQHLRHPQKPRILWIDPLCINQEDMQERGHQVRSMGRVYASAEGVLVWLGPDALNVAEGIFTQLIAFGKAFEYDTMDGVAFTGRIRQYLTQILGMSWFSRVWVVQELTLS